jgi:hypothetical protein
MEQCVPPFFPSTSAIDFEPIALFFHQEFIPPTAPVLLQILSGAHTAADLLPPGSIYTLPPNSVIEISVPGGTPGAPHPFHLHGVGFTFAIL